MIFEQVYHSPASVRIIRNTGCFGMGACGRFNTVVWQGYCGCWAFKCCNCGNVEYAACCDTEDEQHWAEFEEAAEALT